MYIYIFMKYVLLFQEETPQTFFEDHGLGWTIWMNTPMTFQLFISLIIEDHKMLLLIVFRYVYDFFF